MGIAEVLATYPGSIHAVVLEGQFKEGEADLIRNQAVIAKVKVVGLRDGYTKPAKAISAGSTCSFSVVGHSVGDGDYLLFTEKDLMSGVANITDTIILPG